MIIKNCGKHFVKICKHKHYVFKNCCKAGIPFRGIKHDLSKFSPTEFFESVKYYVGTSSPIDECKKRKGYSKAWLHHKGRNKHHYEYWQDNFDLGGEPMKMPFKDTLELVCDYVGAGQAYLGTNFTYEGEFNWWLTKCKKPLSMHPQTKSFVTKVLKKMKNDNSNNILKHKKRLKRWYKEAEQGTIL